MSSTPTLKKGDQVSLNLPFLYTIGEEGPVTGNILLTVEDCIAEVRAEIEYGLNSDEVFIELAKNQE